jgi:hypothetical protein
MAVLDEIYSNAYGSESRARDLFDAACLKGLVSKGKAFFTGKKNTLLGMNSLIQGKKISTSHYQGKQKVSIDKIKGSEGRCEDFNSTFQPLKGHSRNRWISIACAFEQGVALPPVDLLKIGDVYVVRDGHHRISVAKAFGASSVDAEVVVLNLSA